MTSAQFKLDKFEGPLDLLLYLISKHKLNIYDIEIAVLLDQYLEYLDNLEYEDYDGTAEFLEMAARLIYIKTCSLLPQDDEAKELKKELEGRIIEYSLCKMAAERLRENYVGGDVFVREPVKLPVNKTFTGEKEPVTLLNAYMGMSEKSRNAKPLKADMFEPIVSHKIVSVTSKIIFILKKLYTGGEFDMDRLYDGITDKSEKVATFLAVLELTKSGRIFLNDDNTRIYMNNHAKKHKIKSDFDEEQSTPVQTAQRVEIVHEDISEDFVPLEDISGEEDIGEKPVYDYDDSRYKPKKHSSYMPAKVRAVECSAPVAAGNLCEEELSEETDVENTDEILSETAAEGNIPENASREIEEQTEIQPVDPQILAELELLANLPVHPPETVFKPNYIGCLRYRWGNSPVGDDNRGNYWKYGCFRY